MKRYMKNKDFIPEKFFDKKQISRSKKEKVILVLFLIINLFLLQATTKSIEEIRKVSIINKANEENNKLSNNEFENVNIWIENILTDDIEEIDINKNKGEIIISSLENIDKISGNKFIKISDVNLRSDGKYKLGVSLYE